MIKRDQKIRWGILGCGKIAEKFASDLLLSENAILMACASRELIKSQSFAKKHRANYSFGSYEELAQFENIDVIYIATPNSFHLEHSILCLKNQKAVLCEKPLSTNTFRLHCPGHCLSGVVYGESVTRRMRHGDWLFRDSYRR